MLLDIVVAGALAAPVLNGIDVLIRDDFKPLQGKRVGLITNHTGRDLAGRSTVDILAEAPSVNLVALFAPEHGIRGDKDERIADGKDEKTGLPVFSLYNPGSGAQRYRPTAEQLKGVEALVFDIQDVGARFYTYIGTMGYAMEEAAKHGIEVIVLDRPNPITGTRVEGPVSVPAHRGLTAYHELPTRHGMTVGELAGLFNTERKIGCKLTVVKMEGWRREMWFEETGQVWINPSPNMRSPIQALLYPGMCLVEATNVSVGRGTDTPFEWIGAPWMDGVGIAAAMNAKNLPGIRFYSRAMTPVSSKHANALCPGVAFIVTDREAFDSVRAGVELSYEINKRHPEWDETKLVNLMHNPAAVEATLSGGSAAASAGWADDLQAFLRVRQRYLLY
ncbi:MAG: DUF1343 domain-containing protein [Fimbriimonadaceae bacterium]|nr:DUF1343 domain-containing protein [Fimbriimonadaceae bacterium]